MGLKSSPGLVGPMQKAAGLAGAVSRGVLMPPVPCPTPPHVPKDFEHNGHVLPRHS